MKNVKETRQVIPAEAGKYQVVIACNSGSASHGNTSDIFASRPFDVVGWEIIHREGDACSGERLSRTHMYPVIARIFGIDGGCCSGMGDDFCLITKGIDGCEDSCGEYESVEQFINEASGNELENSKTAA